MEEINHILSKPKYLEMFALETQVPPISRRMMGFFLMLCQLMHWRQQAPEYQLMQFYLYLDRPCTFCLWDSTKRISFLYDTTVSTVPYQNLSLHLVSISFCYSHQSPTSQFILHQMFYFLCMIYLPVFRLLFRLFVFVVTRDNVFSRLHIHCMKPGL